MKKFIFALALLIPICVLCAEDVSAQSSAYSTKRLRLKGQAVPPTPNPPTGQYNIWVDSATGALNITDSAGTDTPVGAGLSGLTTGTLPVATSSTAIGDSILLQTGVVSIAVNGSDAATNTVSDALILRHATSGTAAAGFGTGLLFQGENAAGTMHDMASVDASYTDATNGSEDTRLDFSVYQAGVEVPAVFLTPNTLSGGNTLHLEAPGSHMYFAVGGADRWLISNSIVGALVPLANNTYDFGYSGGQIKDAYLGTSIQGTRTKTLTDNTITDVVQISSAVENNVTAGHISYTVIASDATNELVQTEVGQVPFLLVNENGTVTVTLGTVGVTAIDSAGGAALSNTFASSVSGTDAKIRITSDYDQATLTGTVTHTIEYRVYIDSGTATVTPQ